MRWRFSEVALPYVAAALTLAGSLGATLLLYRSAATALNEAQEARLRGAGETAALLFADVPPTQERLAALMTANVLDGAYLVDERLRVLADAVGEPRERVDLLRTDPDQLALALSGKETIAASYTLGELEVATGYFPVKGGAERLPSVLALEVGQSFQAPRRTLHRALGLGVLVSFAGAFALALVASRHARAERERRDSTARAAHGAAISQMAAMAAHELRNPLSIIRGTVELMKERRSPSAPPDEGEDLDGILGEVARMRRLTEDFLELSADRSLHLSDTDVDQVLEESRRGTETAFPGVRVRYERQSLPLVHGDAVRLRQVFANLLTNAAQAQGTGELELRTTTTARDIIVEVRDHGPGMPEAIRTRLFDPFVTGKSDGTGLGLALSRRLLERHGGSLFLKEAGPAGTTFEARIPIPPPGAKAPQGGGHRAT